MGGFGFIHKIFMCFYACASDTNRALREELAGYTLRINGANWVTAFNVSGDNGYEIRNLGGRMKRRLDSQLALKGGRLGDD